MVLRPWSVQGCDDEMLAASYPRKPRPECKNIRVGGTKSFPTDIFRLRVMLSSTYVVVATCRNLRTVMEMRKWICSRVTSPGD